MLHSMQTCEIAVLSTTSASFKSVFLELFCQSTVKFIISKQNLLEITREKKKTWRKSLIKFQSDRTMQDKGSFNDHFGQKKKW